MKKLFIMMVMILLLGGCGENTETPGGEVREVDTTVDTIAPVVTLLGDSPFILEVGSAFRDPGASFTDAVDGNGQAIAQGTIDTSVVAEYTISYSKTDAAGNVSNVVTRYVYVVDTTNPVVTLNGDAVVTLEVGSTYTDLGASYTDNYDASGNAVMSGTVNTAVLGTYPITYSYTDASSNKGTISRSVVVVVDTVDPVLDILGNITYTIGDGIPTIADFVTATDNYDGDIISSLDYTFTVGDYLTAGSYALTLTITDSSGNTTSSDITIDVIEVDLSLLSSAAISIVQGLASLFTETPAAITIPEIGDMNAEITQISALTGNGYLADTESTSVFVFNTVTAPEYIEIVGAYNGSLSTMQTYLSAILPLLANVTSYEVEYTFSGYTFTMTKVNDSQYQITATGTILTEEVTIVIVIDELTLFGDYTYSIEFSTSFATWHYEITRGLLGIESIFEVKELLGDSNGVVYANGFFIDGDDLSGFMIKDEITITRRMYFEFTETYKGIYYVNDDTGTEKYISLDGDVELVFEYENYQPNVPLLGSEKARWALIKFDGIYTIEFDDGILSNSFGINATTSVTESDSFDIEAKNYSAYVYNDTTLEYEELTSGNWMLRIEKDYDTDFDSYFVFESFMTPNYTYNVKEQVTSLNTNKETVTLFDISILTITKEEILSAIE